MISESDSSAGHLKQTNCKSHHHEILLSNFPWSYHGISDGNNWKYFMKLEYCQLPNETGTMGLLLQLKETIDHRKKTFFFHICCTTPTHHYSLGNMLQKAQNVIKLFINWLREVIIQKKLYNFFFCMF